MVSQHRKGFTIVELLIGLAIISALTAVALPAIQAARESARLTSCRNNVVQLSKAMIQFEGYYGYFPSGGWSSGWLGVAERAGDSAQPGGWAYSTLPYMEEMATRDIVANVSASQATAAYTKLVSTSVPGFSCPSRRVSQPIDIKGTTFQTASGPVTVTKATRSDYAMNSGSKGACPDLEDFATIIAAAGKLSGSGKKVTICHAPPGNPANDVTMTIALMGLSGHQHHDEDRMGACDTCDDPVVAATPTSLSEGDAWRKMSAAQKLVTLSDMGIPDVQNGMTSRMSRMKAAHASDGLANTYLVGEKYVASNTYYSGTDAGDRAPMMAGYSGDTVRWAFTPPAMDSRGGASSMAVSFGSSHRAGWNMAYADGMVRTVSFSIDPQLHAQLAGRDDGPGVIAIPPQ